MSRDGVLQLLARTGDELFEDVSDRVGLADVTDAALAQWVDYDADGRLDLFVGARTSNTSGLANTASGFGALRGNGREPSLPVFRYLQEQKLPDGSAVPLEYGLIAEEVAEVFPDLVVYDEDGKPFTVKYHLLSAMLLNELKKLHELGKEQSRELEGQRIELTRLRGLEARVDALEAQTVAGD